MNWKKIKQDEIPSKIVLAINLNKDSDYYECVLIGRISNGDETTDGFYCTLGNDQLLGCTHFIDVDKIGR